VVFTAIGHIKKTPKVSTNSLTLTKEIKRNDYQPPKTEYVESTLDKPFEYPKIKAGGENLPLSNPDGIYE